MSESDYEELAPGQEVVRDNSGRFQSTRLTPERASEIRSSRKDYRRELDDLLAEAGYTKSNPAPAYAVAMARQAIKSPSAMRDWRKLTGVDIDSSPAGASMATFETTGHYIVPKPGERCPRCGYMPDIFTPETIQKLVDYAKSKRANASENETP